MLIIAPLGHPPIRTARDLRSTTLLAFEPDCPHRQRLEAWCARSQVAPERIIELGSYHAILGCCIAGMGVALLPAAVLDTYTERGRLSEHSLGGSLRSVRTMLISRRDTVQPKVAALARLLAEQGAGQPPAARPSGRRRQAA